MIKARETYGGWPIGVRTVDVLDCLGAEPVKAQSIVQKLQATTSQIHSHLCLLTRTGKARRVAPGYFVLANSVWDGSEALPSTRARHENDEQLFARIRANVVIDANGCWIWQGARESGGYGFIRLASNRTTAVHRVTARLTKGERPAGLMTCHHCDVRECCNPDHLYYGTAKDNTRDALVRGRHVSARRRSIVPSSETAVVNGSPSPVSRVTR